MKKALARAAYTSLLRLATPLYLARLWWRGRREPGYRQAIAERLGRGVGRVPPAALWVHAVSLGETKAASALIDALRAEQPQLRLLLTHGTATGRAAGAALLKPGDHQAWLPFDTPGAVRRFLRRHRPAIGVLSFIAAQPSGESCVCYLTKPLGLGIISTAIKRGRASAERSPARGRSRNPRNISLVPAPADRAWSCAAGHRAAVECSSDGCRAGGLPPRLRSSAAGVGPAQGHAQAEQTHAG